MNSLNKTEKVNSKTNYPIVKKCIVNSKNSSVSGCVTVLFTAPETGFIIDVTGVYIGMYKMFEYRKNWGEYIFTVL